MSPATHIPNCALCKKPIADEPPIIVQIKWVVRYFHQECDAKLAEMKKRPREIEGR